MSTITPSTSYLEELITSMHTNGYSQPALVQLLFGIIDEYCGLLPPREGPGRPATYSLSTILKLDMLMHLTGKRGETEILREVNRHYRTYFPQLPGQARLWHRIREAVGQIEQFRRALCYRLGVHLEEIRILDTLPLPVATGTSRPGRGNGFDLADAGRCASKKLKFWGFKVGMLITDLGIPDVYDLFPARPHDSQFIDDLLTDGYDWIALGDKGFISQAKQQHLRNAQNVILITYRKKNQHVQNSPLECWALHEYRQLIETVFSQLQGHLHIENPGAKTDLGLVKRLVGIVTAYTLGIYMNFLLGRPLLAIKELFA
jgi:hypothetical protein